MIKVYIHMARRSYGEQLAWFITGKHNPELLVELLTEIKEGMIFDREDYLVTDCGESGQKPECHVVKMVKKPEEAGDNAIFMYQSREEVYQELLRVTETGEKEKKCKLGGVKRIVVFSPEGGDEKTVLALQTAGNLAKKEKVLYISFSGFPVFFGTEFREGSENVGTGLAEVMMSAGGDGFGSRLKELAFPFEKIWILMPANHFKDLLDFSMEDVLKFMEGLKEQTEFDAVVLEMGQLFEYTFELLACADEVLVPEAPGFFSAIRRHVLQRYCRMERQEALWERMQFIPMKRRMPTEESEVKELLSGESGVNWDGKPGESITKGKNPSFGS